MYEAETTHFIGSVLLAVQDILSLPSSPNSTTTTSLTLHTIRLPCSESIFLSLFRDHIAFHDAELRTYECHFKGKKGYEELSKIFLSPKWGKSRGSRQVDEDTIAIDWEEVIWKNPLESEEGIEWKTGYVVIEIRITR